MTVRVNKVVSGKLLSVREFLVDRQLTVSDMLQTSCKQMDCEGKALMNCLHFFIVARFSLFLFSLVRICEIKKTFCFRCSKLFPSVSQDLIL